MQKITCLIILVFAFSSFSNAQEPAWLSKIRQIEPLKSTEKDVEKMFGKPTKRYANTGEYELELGTLSVSYSEGKCNSNEDSEYDVEKGTVVEFDLSLNSNIKFKSLNLNLVGFKKEYSSDALGAFSYENKELGIDYSISSGWLRTIYISPARNYEYLSCLQKPKNTAPIVDDVDRSTLSNLTQFTTLENSKTDVRALFGDPLKSEGDQLDFYMNQKYAITFLYSTGDCTFLNEDKWNVSKGKIIVYSIFFNINGITLSLNFNDLKKKEDKREFSVYEDEARGIEYEIKNNRIWKIKYFPTKKHNDLKCKGNKL